MIYYKLVIIIIKDCRTFIFVILNFTKQSFISHNWCIITKTMVDNYHKFTFLFIVKLKVESKALKIKIKWRNWAMLICPMKRRISLVWLCRGWRLKIKSSLSRLHSARRKCLRFSRRIPYWLKKEAIIQPFCKLKRKKDSMEMLESNLLSTVNINKE